MLVWVTANLFDVIEMGGVETQIHDDAFLSPFQVVLPYGCSRCACLLLQQVDLFMRTVMLSCHRWGMLQVAVLLQGFGRPQHVA